MARYLALVFALSLGAPTSEARAFEFESSGDRLVRLSPTFKQALALPGLSYSRLRLDLETSLSAAVYAEFAYEHQVLVREGGRSTVAGPYLPSMSALPWRVTAEPRAIVEDGESLRWTQGVDRAAISLSMNDVDITLGRQALGLGRGLFFGTMDVFAAFSPLSVDREWRPGVDALHVDWRFTDLFSLDVMAAASEGFEEGVVISRVRGYLGEVDLAVVGGRRAGDWLLGVLGSGALGDAALYAEFATYLTDGRGVPDGLGSEGDWILKGLLGGSYSWDVAAGLLVAAEYHYNGFGLADVQADQLWLLDPAYQQRLARGDGQTLGRHTLGLSVQLSTDAEVQVGLVAVQNLQDLSGAVAPSVVWIVSDTLTLTATGFFPWGEGEAGALPLRSEYGAGEASALLQLAVYE